MTAPDGFVPKYRLTRSIIYDCPALVIDTSLEALAKTARIIVLKGATQADAELILSAMLAAAPVASEEGQRESAGREPASPANARTRRRPWILDRRQSRPAPQCNPHPDAQHGFDRQASHAAERYACECEGWVPDSRPDGGEIVDRITAYLSGGGLFNPELANHDAVRDLLIDCRDALDEYSVVYYADATKEFLATLDGETPTDAIDAARKGRL